MADLIAKHGPTHALARQFLPDEREWHTLPYENADPIGDARFSPVTGVVHRYPDRVLLKVAHSCPVYCRFCFRREMIGSYGEALQGRELDDALEYVRIHPEIWEVILTGGDPLSLSPRRLGGILSQLSAMHHVAVLRIHSRIPIMAPHSIDEDYLHLFADASVAERFAVYLAVHVNHVEELTTPVVAVLKQLAGTGVVLVSQTVLLRGINDDSAVLEALFRTLVRLKIRPYYLHHPDLAPGTSHFRVPLEQGQALMRGLRGKLSGLCLPTYVLDIPGGFGKVPVGPQYAGARDAAGTRVVLDPSGQSHIYPE